MDDEKIIRVENLFELFEKYIYVSPLPDFYVDIYFLRKGGIYGYPNACRMDSGILFYHQRFAIQDKVCQVFDVSILREEDKILKSFLQRGD